ncbi:MAG: histidine--tRNA ligase [Anaplasmataceae bacterium]|nr:histidine--tRNA ligase [Anaplasmataceae bacterium]
MTTSKEKNKKKSLEPTKKASTKDGRKEDKQYLHAPKGMHDYLPYDQLWRDRVRSVGADLAEAYSFGRIETPLVEDAELFVRGIGEETDLVGKEMYTLKTKGGDTLVLRPEGTAPTLRAYLDHGLGSQSQPQRLYYESFTYRYEKPQAGRFRQHTQTGFEIIGGVSDAVYDAEVIIIINRFLRDLKLKNIVLKINSIGCRVCRPTYRQLLINYYKKHEKELCADCQKRLLSNPLRLLDCKNEKCQALKNDAPNILDKICTICSRHFKSVFEYLDEVGVAYELDHRLVRGLDYYSRTVFEFYIAETDLGAVASGGRYDYLAEMLGARPTPGVGGAIGWERIIEAMKIQSVKLSDKNPKKIFVIHVGALAKKKAFKLINDLRGSSFQVGDALGKESLKAQLKAADKEKAVFALIIGQKEIFEESVIVRDLRTGTQETIRVDRLEEELRRRWREVITTQAKNE